MAEWIFSERVLHIGIHVALHSLCHIVLYLLCFGLFWLFDVCVLVWRVTGFSLLRHLWNRSLVVMCLKLGI